MKYSINALYSDGEDAEVIANDGSDQQQKMEKKERDRRDVPTNPPESVFKKLEPNKNRYSILSKDEL